MPNMNVPYSRPNRSLLTLRDEVYAAYGYTPARPSEFVTGYKSPDNFTGHNADNNGVVHAIDIFTDESGNLPEAKGRELAEKLRLIGRATNRFQYLIHDMCPTAGVAWPRIASANTGWEWVDYAGSSPHTDHIHVSMCDLYWGDPAPIPASVYDSTAPWGIAGITPSGTTTTPIQEDDMPITDADAQKIAQAVLTTQVKRIEGGTNTLAWSLGAEGPRTAGIVRQAIDGAVRGVLAGIGGLDQAKIEATVSQAVHEALAGLSVTLTNDADTTP